MHVEEQYLSRRIADIDASIGALMEKRSALADSLALLRGRLTVESPPERDDGIELDEDQGPKGLDIMLLHLPEEGMTKPELRALLMKHEVTRSKKEGMVDVSIDTNLRNGNLEIRGDRYFLSDEVRKSKRARSLYRKRELGLL